MNQRTAYLAKQVIEITLTDGRVSNLDTNFACMWRSHKYILKGQWLSSCICYRRCIFIHKPPNIDHNVAGWAVWMPTILSARDQGDGKRERERERKRELNLVPLHLITWPTVDVPSAVAVCCSSLVEMPLIVIWKILAVETEAASCPKAGN
jgi:hypothetical protein